jgi:hypothetical protein
LSETYTEKIKQCGFEAKTMKIQDYVSNPNNKTYYEQIVEGIKDYIHYFFISNTAFEMRKVI